MSTNKNTDSKTRVVITWPTSHFTIEDVQTLYPSVVNITLRFRIKKAEDAKEIVLIGKVKPAIGRPRKVYAKANPTESLLKEATAAGVILSGTETTTVSVASVNVTPSVKETVVEKSTSTVTA